jgi:membrane protein implicated in regulation of membrane protease activity
MSIAMAIPWWAALIGLIVASALALLIGWAVRESFRTPEDR